MNKEFDKFQKEFKKYQQKFGLTGYQVYFKYELMEECYADITIIDSDRIATVRLNKEGKLDAHKHAKHECLHLLLGKLQHLAHDRYARASEIDSETENLVAKLQDLIE